MAKSAPQPALTGEKVEGVGRQRTKQKHTVYNSVDKCVGENVSVKLMESISGGGKSEACGHNHN